MVNDTLRGRQRDQVSESLLPPPWYKTVISHCQPVCSGVPGLDASIHTTEHLGTAVVGVPCKSGVDCVAPPFQR